MDHLRDIYPEPTPLARAKQLDRLDRHACAFIARSPFLVMATADSEGRCDASPRGDAPGFVAVRDEFTLLLPDRPGNNRVDSLTNVATNPRIGLVFFVPGVLETLRVNGRARFIDEGSTLSGLSANDRLPKSALEVTVEEVFFHCGKALKRSHLWDPLRHATEGELPSFGTILADQTRQIEAKEAEARIAHAYDATLY